MARLTGAFGDQQVSLNAFPSVEALEGTYDVCFNSCINSVCGISGLDLGKALHHRPVRMAMLDIMREGDAVAQAMGLDVPRVKPHMLKSTCFLTWLLPWAALGSQTGSSADTRSL